VTPSCAVQLVIENILLKRANPRCDQCEEPLEVSTVSSRGISPGGPEQTMLERYAAFYPFEELDSRLSLGEGFTPLIASRSLSSELNLGPAYIKNETTNPTWSFKGRGTVTALQQARWMGYDRIGTVSSGNMAASVAAYGARAPRDVCFR